MTDKKDGGQAFPAHPRLYSIANQHLAQGMSLRDWFAGQALRAKWGNGQSMTPEDAAQFCYQLADAMLEARED